MELDITAFFTDCEPAKLSASAAELGPNAGRITWQNAKEAVMGADPRLLAPEGAREAFNDYAKGFGAWSDDEIEAWSDDEAEALLAQMIAGDMREAGLEPDASPEDWARYEADENARGSIYRGDNGRVYFYLGI